METIIKGVTLYSPMTTKSDVAKRNMETIVEFFSLYLKDKPRFYSLWVKDAPEVVTPFVRRACGMDGSERLLGSHIRRDEGPIRLVHR